MVGGRGGGGIEGGGGGREEGSGGAGGVGIDLRGGRLKFSLAF